MRIIAATLAVALTGGLLAAQGPRCTSSLRFASDAKVSVSYRQLDLAGGVTLKNLMSKGEQGKQFRSFFNQNGFKSRIGGRIELSHTTKLGGTDLDAGKYLLSFKIDDDLIWHAVILNDKDEEICALVLDTKEKKSTTKRLVIRPVAKDNKKGNGHLLIQFGKMTAKLPFHCSEGSE